jgi:hypothetical protein
MYARELRLQKESVKNIKHTESHVQLKLEATPRSGHVSETGRSLTSSDRTLSSQSRDRSLTADDLKRVGPTVLGRCAFLSWGNVFESTLNRRRWLESVIV